MPTSITVVNLADTHLHGTHISYELAEAIASTLHEGKQVLLFFNRRGYGRALICPDCGYYWQCPYCDIAFSYHADMKCLLCHHCNAIESIPVFCKNCQSIHITPVGIGIERVEYALRVLFPHASLVRVDSDTKKNEKFLLSSLKDMDIILGTQMALTLTPPKIGLVSFLLLDTELTIPEYDIEERIYLQCSYAMKQGAEVILQTYIRESSLINNLLFGNYKTFLNYTLSERKKYGYPPYGQLILLSVRDWNKEKVRDIITKLVNKLKIYITNNPIEKIFLAYDRDIWEKRGGEWIQKIILKGRNTESILNHIRGEVVRNRGITLERK